MGCLVEVLGKDTSGNGEGGEGVVPMEGFDVIICSNAFVLFPAPAAVIRHWGGSYLRSWGLLVVDIPHEKNMRSAVLMADVAARIGMRFDLTGGRVGGREKCGEMLEGQGFVVEMVVELSKVEGRREVCYGNQDVDEQFEYVVKGDLASWRKILEQGGEEKVRVVFREEFGKMEESDGKVEVVEGNWVFLTRSCEGSR
jgi:hypothetical protein